MVLKIFSNNNVYVYKDIDNTFFRTKSYGGMKYLQFDISIKHYLYKYLVEETRLEYDGQYYLIKGVNERSSAGICTINAELDLTGLENKVYLTHTWTTESFINFTRDILNGTGWTITNAELISKRTTTEAKDQTPRDLLEKSTNATSYGACFEYDTKNKTITCIKPENITTPTGVYFSDELNLSELTMKGSSSTLVTKLYPIGKDGLTIEGVNNGKTYIENYTYTDKVIARVWRDERYTNAQSLLDDAIVKLNALANPERSYTCKVINLAKTNPATYGTILSFELYDVITLVDRIRGRRVDHRIVELKEYPADHTLDTVTLSSIAGRISGAISNINNRITELDAQQLHDRTKVNEIKQDLDTTVLRVSESWAESENSSIITQTSEGIFLEVDKVIGEDVWSTKLQESATDVQIAWNDITKKIQFAGGELRIHDTALAQSQQLRSVFNENGNHFYRGGSYIGKIGTNQWYSNNTYKGLVFDLEYAGSYMAFAQEESENVGTYTTMLCFARAHTAYADYGLHLGCDFNGHGYTLKNIYFDDVSVVYRNAKISAYTGEIPIITEMSAASSNGSVSSVNWKYSKLRISNGVIVGYWVDNKPFYLSATTISNRKISITFNESIDPSSLVSSDFTVNINGLNRTISSASLNSNNSKVVELALGLPVLSASDTITVAYTKGSLKSTDGDNGYANSFSARAVTNTL